MGAVLPEANVKRDRTRSWSPVPPGGHVPAAPGSSPSHALGSCPHPQGSSGHSSRGASPPGTAACSVMGRPGSPPRPPALLPVGPGLLCSPGTTGCQAAQNTEGRKGISPPCPLPGPQFGVMGGGSLANPTCLSDAPCARLDAAPCARLDTAPCPRGALSRKEMPVVHWPQSRDVP